MTGRQTEQEQHWAGPAGDAYIERQRLTIESRRAMFKRILDSTDPKPDSIMEYGASVGDNLRAIRALLGAHLAGTDINQQALEDLKQIANETFYGSITDPCVGNLPKWDMTMTRGVLIHIPPDQLAKAYATLYRRSSRYILIAEYYNPKPVMIPYRGQDNLLWKRDFAGEMMDDYPDLKLRDCGFVYHRDPEHPQDDVTWFLLEQEQR